VAVKVFRERSTWALDHTPTEERETVESVIEVTMVVTGFGANRRRLMFDDVTVDPVIKTESVALGGATVVGV
jgi:hypothetical protein